MNRYRRPDSSSKSKKRGLVLTFMIFGVVTASVLFFWGSWRGTEVEEVPAPPSIAPKPTIDRPRIVVFLPLSGPFQEEGHSLREGLELGWEELKGEGFHGEMVLEDAAGEDFQVLRAAGTAVAHPGNVLLIAHTPSHMFEKLIPLCEKHGVALIAPAGTHEYLANSDRVITLVSSDGAEAFQAGQMASRLGFSEVTAVHDSSPYGELLWKGFSQGALERGLEVQEVAIPKNMTLNSTSLMEASGSDLVFLAGPPLWGVEAAEILSQMGHEGKLMVPQVYDRYILDDLSGHYEGRLLVMRAAGEKTGWEGEGPQKQFMHKFVAEHLREPDWLAALGYDTLQWIRPDLQQESLERETFRRDLLQRFTAGQTFRGASGKVFFGPHGEANRELHAFIYREGQLLPVMDSTSSTSAAESAEP